MSSGLSYIPALSRYDRRCRRERIVAAYRSGSNSRIVAKAFGVSDGHVRAVVREAGASRPVGRPSGKQVEMAVFHVGLPDPRASYEGRPFETEAAECSV